jgi:hypothetical protein
MVYWLISFILYSIGITIAYIITDRSRTKAVRKFRGMEQYLDRLNAQGLLPDLRPKSESSESNEPKAESSESNESKVESSESDQTELESSQSNESEANSEITQSKSRWTLSGKLDLDKYSGLSDFIHGSIFDYGNWFSIIGLALSFSIFMVVPILVSLLGFFRSKRLSKRTDYFAKAGIIVGLCKIGLFVLFGVCIVGLCEGQAGMKGYFSSLISFTRIADFCYQIKSTEPSLF